MSMLSRWRERRHCFHHDHHTGQTWITSMLIDMGSRKQYRCTHCDRMWIG